MSYSSNRDHTNPIIQGAEESSERGGEAKVGGHAQRRHAIILAGGSGTRLWPLSRSNMPKQLLALTSELTLLQETAQRLLPMIAAQRVTTVTHADHRFEVMGQLHEVESQLAAQVLAEPVGRNTLPAIAWAVARIAQEEPDAVIGVFPSDHRVTDAAALRAAWVTAELATAHADLVLFGIQPDYAATGFGYIQAGEELSHGVARVKRFVEKPDADTAADFLRDGGYYWNSGMFVFRAGRFMALLEDYQPELAAAVRGWTNGPQTPEGQACAPDSEAYAALPNVSIDYGLVEHADSVAVVPVQIGWSDLGSWEALYQERAHDAEGNVGNGPVLPVETHDSLLWSADGGLVAGYGLESMAIIQTRDATLVTPRHRLPDLKRLVAEVKKRQPELTESHVTVARPWGSYTTLESGHRYKLKRIVVKPGCKLSLQMHYHRSEHWVVIAGTARVVNGEEEIYLEENQSTYVPATQAHRLENPGRIPLQIIEIQTGPYLEEDDLVRFEDIYGRMAAP